ncbi:MAG: CRISPR-associated protein Cas4 [Chitinispirillaceae bacterium]|nr:CRISPR-associated protein Cas4 [Chitinispirillaceae bacterium]
MYQESDLLPISALQHIIFCERQCALIHIERQWAENRLTAEGQILHEKTDKEGGESRGNLRIARALYIHNFELGLYGKADVVEFHKGSSGVVLPNVEGLWKPFPVEYKRGKPKADCCDEVQLCAQALCLEEMLCTSIQEGALFYGTPRRRTAVQFDGTLRSATKAAAEKLHTLITNGITPPAVYVKKCDNCSLIELCMPKMKKIKKADAYINTFIAGLNEDTL